MIKVHSEWINATKDCLSLKLLKNEEEEEGLFINLSKKQ